MELHRTPTAPSYVLFDQNMKLVRPGNEYLEYQALRGRTANTLRAYARDLKIYFEFLEQRDLRYDDIDVSMIREYVEFLRSPDTPVAFLYTESKRTPATINRMIGTIHGFYSYHAIMHGIAIQSLQRTSAIPTVPFAGCYTIHRKAITPNNPSSKLRKAIIVFTYLPQRKSKLCT